MTNKIINKNVKKDIRKAVKEIFLAGIQSSGGSGGEIRDDQQRINQLHSSAFRS